MGIDTVRGKSKSKSLLKKSSKPLTRSLITLENVAHAAKKVEGRYGRSTTLAIIAGYVPMDRPADLAEVPVDKYPAILNHFSRITCESDRIMTVRLKEREWRIIIRMLDNDLQEYDDTDGLSSEIEDQLE